MIDSTVLQHILEEQETVLHEMLELEDQTRQVLIERDVHSLEKINNHKEQLAAKMQELETKRAAAVPEGITLKDCLHREEPQGSERLEQLRQSILTLHDALRSKQKISRRLLIFNQQLVEQAMQLFMPGSGNELYSASGEKKHKESLRMGILDSNA